MPNYSLYHDEFGKEYSLADLNLASWPSSRQLPFAMSVKANVSDGYNNYEVTASCNADFTCGDNYIVSKANVKNVILQNFRVTGVTYFRANLGGEPTVDDILKNKRQSAGRSSNTSNVSANTASVNGAGLPTNTSRTNPSANYTPTYTKRDVTNQVVAGAAVVAAGLLDEWNAASERKAQKRDAERSATISASTQKRSDKFEFVYLPLMDLAKKGDEEARMILYFTSQIFSREFLVPLRQQGFEKALTNNNMDALLYNKMSISGYENKLPYMEKIAGMGSVDAMMWLAYYCDYTKAGNDPAKAMEWYKKAAEKGSPNAMYYLGMIYKYGSTMNGSHSRDNKPKWIVKYDVVLDEKIAFDWFTKSLQPDYAESAYSKSQLNRHTDVSFFDKDSYLELANIYKKGKVVPKDLAKVNELQILYYNYEATQAFNYIK